MGKSTTSSKLSSMTGFGESEVSAGGYRVQIKTVNSRFLDVVIKLPSALSVLEQDISKKIRAKLKRGRLELVVSRESGEIGGSANLNAAFLTESIKQVSEMNLLGVEEKDLKVAILSALLGRKEAFDGTGIDQGSSEDRDEILGSVDLALAKLLASRAMEGEALFQEISLQLASLEKLVLQIKKLSEGAPLKIKERIQGRVKELLDDVKLSQERLEQEVAFLADRADIREELVRLDSHVKLFYSSLSEGGRKLEFVLQEMGREVNTIGSKSVDAEVSTLVIEAKSILEKIREQVLNVE